MIHPIKKRGRPNKTETEKKRDRLKKHTKEEKDIVITLPACSDDDDSENDGHDGHDDNDGHDESNESNENDINNDYYTINHSDEDNDLGYISSNGDYKDESDDTDVYKEFKERDKLIKKLQDENQALRQQLDDVKKKGSNINSIGKKELTEKMSRINILDIVNSNKIVLKSKCEIDCHHCTLDISGIPWLMPVSYVNNAYYVNRDRIFCSPNCMLRYNERILNDHRQKIRHGLIIQLYQQIYETDTPLKSALDPEDWLKKFGKDWTRNKYKQNLNILTNNATNKLPIMIPCMTVDEVANVGINCTDVV